MAKLNVTIPAVDVTVDGVTFRKVARDVRDGDIVRVTDEDAPSYVIEGAFYKVEYVDASGDPQIEDEDGDEYDLGSTDYEVYEAATQASAPSVEYREVKRKAAVGERIRIVDKRDDRYDNGDEFVVDADAGSGDVFVKHPLGANEGRACVAYVEYVVLEAVGAKKAEKPALFKNGDYVKVTDAGGDHNAKVGDIAVITNDNWCGSGTIIDVETLDGRKYGMCKERFTPATAEEVAEAAAPKFSVGDKVRIISGAGERYLIGYVNGDVCDIKRIPDHDGDYTLTAPRGGVTPGNAKPEQLAKLTAEEAAAIEKEAQEIAKWAQINRKVGEFKRGDIVTSAKYCGNARIVTAQIEDVGTDLLGLRAADGEYHAVDKDGVKLVTPVEQRFDTETAA